MTREEKEQLLLDLLHIEGNTKKMIISIITQNITSVPEERLDQLIALLEAP